MQRVTDLLSRFRKDERGVFLVIFAVLAIVLIATSGAVVDFTMTQQARTRAQTALDSAALALQAEIGKTGVTADTLKAKAQTILNEQLNDPSITAVVTSATPTVNSGRLNLQAYIQVPTAFVQLVGITSIRSNLQSEVMRASSDLEVSVSLDVTGSMKKVVDKKGNVTSDKIGDLITATKTLINLLVQTNQSPTYSKMAIVPWSAGVNVGSTYATNVRGTLSTTFKTITGASWSTGTNLTISSVTKATLGVVTTSVAHGLVDGDTVYFSGLTGMTNMNGNYYTVKKVSNTTFTFGVKTTNFSTYTANSGKVIKCQFATCPMVITSAAHAFTNGYPIYIESVGGATGLNGNLFTTANVTTDKFALSGTLGPSYGTYTTGGKIPCGEYGCAYRTFISAAGSPQRFAASTCVSDRTTNAYTDAAPSTTKLGINYPSSNGCLSTEIQPLTSDKDKLTTLAGKLVAEGSTAGHLGLAWGWYMIAPNFSYLWPANSKPKDYGSDNLIKAVVFMTDGVFNTPYCSGVIAADAGTSSGNSSDHINCNSTNGSSKAQAQAICDEIKLPKYNTLLYVVGFDLAGDTTSLEFLRGCATAVDYFFQADNGADLTDAFKKIAQSLSELRISK